jgi:serine/threonine-protein kinase RsbW
MGILLWTPPRPDDSHREGRSEQSAHVGRYLLPRIRHQYKTLAEFRQRRHLHAKVLFDAHLALEEIVTNVISHGFEDPEKHHIRIGLCLKRGELRAEVEDDGKAFNPLEVTSPDTERPLTERLAGGLGIHLARNLMDEITYQRRQGRNVLVMKRKVETQG